eukprot:EC793452.1.p3 GENE.EC793452.1~~EC793452.1.p3  ORF type:complete len:71 (+),score=8.80 EC793452.1:411-623(+)
MHSIQNSFRRLTAWLHLLTEPESSIIGGIVHCQCSTLLLLFNSPLLLPSSIPLLLSLSISLLLSLSILLL